jgi:hypothetical protein
VPGFWLQEEKEHDEASSSATASGLMQTGAGLADGSTSGALPEPFRPRDLLDEIGALELEAAVAARLQVRVGWFISLVGPSNSLVHLTLEAGLFRRRTSTMLAFECWGSSPAVATADLLQLRASMSEHCMVVEQQRKPRNTSQGNARNYIPRCISSDSTKPWPCHWSGGMLRLWPES